LATDAKRNENLKNSPEVISEQSIKQVTFLAECL